MDPAPMDPAHIDPAEQPGTARPRVSLRQAAARPTAVVACRTTWAEYPALWPVLLAEARAAVREPARPGSGVMLYLDDAPSVEVGVEVTGPFRPSGRVIASALPAGLVATTVHRGPYSGLGAAHRAVRDWCAAGGHPVLGPLWEVYGDWSEDPAELETEITYLVRAAPP